MGVRTPAANHASRGRGQQLVDVFVGDAEIGVRFAGVRAVGDEQRGVIRAVESVAADAVDDGHTLG